MAEHGGPLCLSVDGGGTKIAAILFDENLHLRGQGRSGAINPMFVSESAIHQHFNRCLDQLFIGREATQIAAVFVSMPGPADLFIDLLRKRTSVGSVQRLSEGQMCLAAGLLRRTGLVALAGTGSGVFIIDRNVQRI